MQDTRGWSLYCEESFHLAELAYSYGYGLACHWSPIYGRIVHTVLVTPGVFALETDPNLFGQERMTKSQVKEYTNLSDKLADFNYSWS